MLNFEDPRLDEAKLEYEELLNKLKQEAAMPQNTQMNPEQKKAIENMTLKSYIGYTGVMGEFQAVKSDAQESNKFWGQVLDGAVMVASLALSVIPPVGLAIGAIYAGAKAIHGLITEKDIFTGEKLSNEDKAWLGLDAVASVISVGATSKILSSTSNYAKVGNAIRMSDNVINVAQMTMLTAGGAYALSTGNWKDPSFLMTMGLAGLAARKGMIRKVGTGKRVVTNQVSGITKNISRNINDVSSKIYGKIKIAGREVLEASNNSLKNINGKILNKIDDIKPIKQVNADGTVNIPHQTNRN
jgi:hypothetical protein